MDNSPTPPQVGRVGLIIDRCIMALSKASTPSRTVTPSHKILALTSQSRPLHKAIIEIQLDSDLGLGKGRSNEETTHCNFKIR